MISIMMTMKSIMMMAVKMMVKIMLVGVEQNRNRNFVQESKLLFLSEDYQKYQHSGYNCQEESRKNILSISLSLKTFWINIQEEYVLPAFFLIVISGSLQTKTRISILGQSFGSSSAQPLHARERSRRERIFSFIWANWSTRWNAKNRGFKRHLRLKLQKGFHNNLKSKFKAFVFLKK